MSAHRNSTIHICIIGAGMSGLCMTKHLKQNGFKNITVFESTSRVAGLWNYEASPQYPHGLYKNLTTNLEHSLMQFPDLPFPNSSNIKQYPHHSIVLKYIQYYANYFDIQSFIKFNHKIIKIIPPNLNNSNINLPQWIVYYFDNFKEMKHETFDIVIVCNGHYRKTYIPHIVGINKYKKQMFHSRYYREPFNTMFDDKIVLIIGYRASGIDIGMEIFFECKNVKLYQVTNGKQISKSNKYYINKPHRFMYKDYINQFGDNSSVEFSDGDIIYPDIVIFCTGYLYDFPFLDSKLLKDFSYNQSVNGLYQHIIYPHIPSLYFVGIPFRNVPALIIHYQCIFITKILSDLKYSNNNNNFESKYLPTKYDMIKWIILNKQNSGKKNQHYMDVKQFDYVKELCLLSKDNIPINLNKLKNMYINKNKPIKYLKSNL